MSIKFRVFSENRGVSAKNRPINPMFNHHTKTPI